MFRAAHRLLSGALNYVVSFWCSYKRKKDEVTGEWRKLHNEELNDLYSLPNIVRVIKSR
jgi:hypothetical protein